MRWDRSITLWLSCPVIRAIPTSPRLPILMYHSVSDDLEENVSPYYRLATSPQRFADQMRWISERGYRGVSLEEAIGMAAFEQRDQRPVVAITFDDGFRDFYTAAWPVLQCHQFTATIYLPTGFIADRRASFNGRECMTWNEVRELRREGIRFGSHTVSHPKLHAMEWSEIERELTLSRQQIEENIEEPVTSFAYPYAFPQEDQLFTQRFSSLLLETGYRNCSTTVIGCPASVANSFFLKRLPVNSCDDRALLEAKLDGAYDWLGVVQSAYRHFKRTRRSKT